MLALAKLQVDVLNLNISEHIEGIHPQKRARHSSIEKKTPKKPTVLDEIMNKKTSRIWNYKM
jgi:hypothetical protein